MLALGIVISLSRDGSVLHSDPPRRAVCRGTAPARSRTLARSEHSSRQRAASGLPACPSPSGGASSQRMSVEHEGDQFNS